MGTENSLVRCFYIALLLLTLSSPMTITGAKPYYGRDKLPNILILNSYHQGHIWSDDELEGVTSTLRRKYPNLLPTIEYLDTKHFPHPDHLLLIKDYLAKKYQGQRIDLLMVLDNTAFNFALQYHSELFSGAPIVFAGVNGFQPKMLQSQANVTGVAEEQDIAGTLRLALSFHPQTRQVFIIHDYTVSGRMMGPDLEAIGHLLPNPPKITLAPNVSFAELEQQLQALPPDALVLLLVYVPDWGRQFSSHEESSRLVAAASPVPVYAVHATQLGYGIVGGLLLEGNEQGRQAGELALRVLAGEDPAHIPVAHSHSTPMFDDVQLRRFKISPAALPENSKIINQPPSFYTQHQQLVLTATAILAMLVLAVIILSVQQFLRNMAQQANLSPRCESQRQCSPRRSTSISRCSTPRKFI